MNFQEFPPSPQLVEVFKRHSPDVTILRLLVHSDPLFQVRVIESLDGGGTVNEFKHLSISVIRKNGKSRLPTTLEVKAACEAAGFDCSKCEQYGVKNGIYHVYQKSGS